jgi:hypothetical protein
MLETIKQILSNISWPIAVLIMFIFLRRPLARLLDRTTKISAGKDGVTIEALKKDIEETKKTLAGTIAAGVPEQKEFTEYKDKLNNPELSDAEELQHLRYRTETNIRKILNLDEKRWTRKPNEKYVPNDPQKNQWGKLSQNKNRKLTAEVEQMPGNTNLYKVKLLVSSTSAMDPLRGTVWFHLHPTFANPDLEAEVVNGKAELFLLSWGSFTVGAETDNKTIELELDLGELPGVPEHFKNT